MKRTAILGLALLVTIGCQSSRQRQRETGPRPGAFVPPPTPAPIGQGFAPGAGAPIPVQPGVAPAGGTPFPVVQDPNFPANNPPPGNPTFPVVPPGPTPMGNAPGASGKVEANWQPAEGRSQSPFEGRVLLGPPEAIAGESKENQKRLYPPQGGADAGKGPLAATSLPVGIPQFAYVTPKISAGLRPALDDGLGWLQTNNYRTVVHIRLPGENDDADRKQAEARGLKYVSFEVSPNLLAKETVDDLFKLLRDAQQQPVFLYDRDGALAGGLWYLWFRLVEEATDDVARIRARTLGLREEREGAHRDMWQSTQKLLNELKTP